MEIRLTARGKAVVAKSNKDRRDKVLEPELREYTYIHYVEKNGKKRRRKEKIWIDVNKMIRIA